MDVIDLAGFRSLAPARGEAFRSAQPFPHIVLDDFLNAAVARELVEEFALSTLDWGPYFHVNEKKLAVEDRTQMGPTTQAVIAVLQSEPFLTGLRRLTGIDALIADPALDGGGVQQMPPGGFLNVHRDFLAHTTQTTWSRQINLLLYLNPDWPESYRGWLELWDRSVERCVQRIAPLFNRCVIFQTSEVSFHGIPSGVHCPAGQSRKAMALYYFRDEGRVCALRPTHYVALPGDPPMKRLLIGLDQRALYLYSLLKRYTPLGNRLATGIIKRLIRPRRRQGG
jgi:Rps23 Pro-64 3,4-dihydroxylase Tpa1-like proline 4-hydroxylase